MRRQYLIESDERIVVIRTLAVFSALLVVLIRWLMRGITEGPLVTALDLLEIPSVPIVFEVLFRVFDSFLWKRSVFGFRLSRIPDFSGEWHGRLNWNRNGQRRGTEITMVIRQNWWAMSIHGSTTHSKSNAEMISIDPRAGAIRYDCDIDYHSGGYGQDRGTASLRFTGGDLMAGTYYTANAGTRAGTVALTKS